MITPPTKAIVPVHVYGHPCDVNAFDELGRKYGLKIIYDAAHAFGVKINGKSIAEYGDASMFSFHSTKLFHSIEGGLLVFKDPALQQKVDQLKNFAILSETECVDVGTNEKMNEMQALMGELCLEVVDKLIEKRESIFSAYQEAFHGTPIQLLERPNSMYEMPIEHNYAYCPVLVKSFEERERIYNELKKANVFSRRYFYPLVTEFDPYLNSRGSGNVVCAHDVASRVLTLPTSHELTLDEVAGIAECVKKCFWR